MPFIRLLFYILDRLSILLGAFFGSQIPAFIYSYTQRLSGHVAELNQLSRQVDHIAANASQTTPDYISHLAKHTDELMQSQGLFLQALFERTQNLTFALAKLQQSSLPERPFVFLSTFQYDIAKSTLKDFQPALNLSAEGLIYTAIGSVLGYVIFRLLKKVITLGYYRVSTCFQ